MEEALESPDVADRGLGDDDALEAPGHVGTGLVGRPQAGQGEQVAHRDHADQRAVVDHREVAVVVVRQAGPGRAGLLVGSEGVGIGGHPQAHRFAAGSASAAAAAKRSRSVRIPTTLSRSVTTNEPVRAARIERAASASDGPRLAGERRGRHQVPHHGCHGRTPLVGLSGRRPLRPGTAPSAGAAGPPCILDPADSGCKR